MNLSVAELKKALNIRIKKASSIRTKIAKLEANIARLKKQLDEIMGGKSVKPKSVRRKRRKVKAQVKVKALPKPKQIRIKNKGGITLKDMLVKVLEAAGKPQNIDQIVMRLKKSGYRTAAKDIKKQVGVRLYTGKDFVKTAPGMFTLKAMGAKVSKKASKTIVKKSSATGKKTK
ncbi:MAG: winged helix-turn-helix domain-containing protein [Kiritimatiellae bacterium]|nr:winged helix-turn-helix domain-containing protein [Verrucomicrobiota bacterium]MCG2660283.1 winged helix-turn-helix domain-containing protein [Kiritimatiellia bacterium]